MGKREKVVNTFIDNDDSSPLHKYSGVAIIKCYLII